MPRSVRGVDERLQFGVGTQVGVGIFRNRESSSRDMSRRIAVNRTAVGPGRDVAEDGVIQMALAPRLSM